MKIGRALTLTLAAAGLLAFAAPAYAQTRGANRGGNAGGNFNRAPGANLNRAPFHRGDGDRDDRGRFFVRRGGVNVFVGGGFWGWPYWGPYWGYPYYYPYGYYAPPPYYQGEPAGVYNGRVMTNDGGKDASLAAQVQQRLARAGYYHGPVDGIIGEGTRRAIRNYERDNGLRADGEIDRQLLRTMGLS